MAAFWKKYGWIAATVVGSALFALGFSLFLAPNEINTGGLSGLAQIAVHVLGVGSIGSCRCSLQAASASANDSLPDRCWVWF